MRKGVVLFVSVAIIIVELGLPLALGYVISPNMLICTDPPETPAINPASIDIVQCYYANDAYYYQFQILLAATPDTSQGKHYAIFLNTKSGGTTATNAASGPYLGADYQLYYDNSGTFFYKWDNTLGWVLVTPTPITVDVTSVLNTIIFTGILSDIGYPWTPIQDMGFYIATYIGGAQLNNPRDFCTGTINYYDVPQVPWLVLPIFAAAVVVTVSLLYKYKFRAGKSR